MPYIRKGKCVYKKNSDGSHGEKVGCSETEDKAKRYLKRLYAVEEGKIVKITRNQIRNLIREEVSRLLEQGEGETIPASHLIFVGDPAESIVGMPNMWYVAGRVTEVDAGTVVETHDVRGASSAEDAMSQIQPWIEQMKEKYPAAKIK